MDRATQDRATQVMQASQADRHHTDQGNERKQQLLGTAEQLFAARGYAHTRIADICAAAGVAKGLFYWYFPTKESLFAELVRSMRQRLRRAQAAAMDPAADPLTRIRQGTEASVRFMAEHRSYFALLDVERGDHAVASLLREGSDIYADDVIRLVREAQAGALVTDGEPRLQAVGVMGAVSSFSHAWRNGVLDIDIEELVVAVGDWVIGGLTAPAEVAAGRPAHPSHPVETVQAVETVQTVRAELRASGRA